MAEEKDTQEQQNWLQDNLRIFISVVIVVALAAGIYSYSQRTQVPIALQTKLEDKLYVLTAAFAVVFAILFYINKLLQTRHV